MPPAPTNSRGSAGPTWTPLAPSGSIEPHPLKAPLRPRPFHLRGPLVAWWPRNPGTLPCPDPPPGPPPQLGFRGLEGPSAGRKAGLAWARPWGQTQPPPQSRPLHAGSSGIQPPARPSSFTPRPHGTAAVRDGEDSSVHGTEHSTHHPSFLEWPPAPATAQVENNQPQDDSGDG